MASKRPVNRKASASTTRENEFDKLAKATLKTTALHALSHIATNTACVHSPLLFVGSIAASRLMSEATKRIPPSPPPSPGPSDIEVFHDPLYFARMAQ